MDDEPRGHTIDGTPWEEPRPPHLPDTLTRISLWVIPFLVLAGFQLVAGWREWAGQGQLNPGYGVTIFLGLVPGVCASLLGAALFYRHPSANRRLSILVFGVVLLAVTALMELASRPLDEWFLALSPSADFSSGMPSPSSDCSVSPTWPAGWRAPGDSRTSFPAAVSRPS
jgi:hypothetical protein